MIGLADLFNQTDVSLEKYGWGPKSKEVEGRGAYVARATLITTRLIMHQDGPQH